MDATCSGRDGTVPGSNQGNSLSVNDSLECTWIAGFEPTSRSLTQSRNCDSAPAPSICGLASTTTDSVDSMAVASSRDSSTRARMQPESCRESSGTTTISGILAFKRTRPSVRQSFYAELAAKDFHHSVVAAVAAV